jgi:hypothetical protein
MIKLWKGETLIGLPTNGDVVLLQSHKAPIKATTYSLSKQLTFNVPIGKEAA